MKFDVPEIDALAEAEGDQEALADTEADAEGDTDSLAEADALADGEPVDSISQNKSWLNRNVQLIKQLKFEVYLSKSSMLSVFEYMENIKYQRRPFNSQAQNTGTVNAFNELLHFISLERKRMKKFAPLNFENGVTQWSQSKLH